MKVTLDVFDTSGKPETLRLFFATPKRWLEDGKKIKIERAPTAEADCVVENADSLWRS